MRTSSFALMGALLSILASFSAVQAQDYVVPVTLNSKTYTLTVSVKGDAVTVESASPDIRIGAVTQVTATTPTANEADLEALKASAVSVPYDDLFRYNEQHVGKFVRYVGEVVQVKKTSACCATIQATPYGSP